jgi:arginase family enzyme
MIAKRTRGLPPTFAIDHPEAMFALERIEARTGLTRAGVFEHAVAPMRAGVDLGRRLPSEPFIVINGSGNFHHETVALVEGMLSAEASPAISYLQIDAHPDKEIGYRWVIGCASFVGRILEHPKVDTVHLLGINPECSGHADTGWAHIDHLGYYRCDYFAKLRLYSAPGTRFEEVVFDTRPEVGRSARASMAVAQVRRAKRQLPTDPAPRDALIVRWKDPGHFDPEALAAWPVYLSIDLDVVRDTIVTDWRRVGPGIADNQGALSWEELLALVERITAARPIRGADVCGLTAALEGLPPELHERSLAAMVELYRLLADRLTTER